MKGRWGLQAAMTATYVAVTAGAVLLTELVIFGVAAFSPAAPVTAGELQARVQATAAGLAAKVAKTPLPAAGTGGLPGALLGTPGVAVTPGRAQPDDMGGITVPQTPAPLCDPAPASFAVVVGVDGTVLGSSYPACFSVGGRGSAALTGAPRKVLASYARPTWSSGHASLPAGNVVWAAAPVTVGPGVKGGSGGTKVLGLVYLEVPASAAGPGGTAVSAALLISGLVALAVAVPAGLAFGLLSTRRLTRRLTRLAALTLEVADGGFDRRVPVSGHDEVSQLEENFNRMASQLEASLDARRQLAEANARHQERSRIARELHDAISQELFSLSVLAGGLRRSLAAGSAAATAVAAMERTAGGAMREMQSLLLALRPVALDEVGLVSAIEGVCLAYTERLGVPVRSELEPVALSPALEHAVLRVTQEALANAARHADAALITVRLTANPGTGHAAGDDQVVLEITDDGRGFDVAAGQERAGGLGLLTMRDRVREHRGQLTIDSGPGTGTRVRAGFPVRPR